MSFLGGSMTSGMHFVFGADIDGPGWEDAVKGCEWNFVRSGSQLALYEEARKPTGHVMTAWEAWTAYGREVIDEAIECGSAVLKETKDATDSCLLRRREALGISRQVLALSAGVRIQDVFDAETASRQVSIRTLQRLAFGLGLDERLLSFKADCGADTNLGEKLKVLQSYVSGLSPQLSQGDAASLAEAASVTRVHTRLRSWLGSSALGAEFSRSEDFGNELNPEARQAGYRLAEDLRVKLGLGDQPVASMRDLLAERLGVTTVWTELSPTVAGATFACADHEGNQFRGIALNTNGENEDVLTRRVTLARELGHALFDPDNRIRNMLVHGHLTKGFVEETHDNPVDQRADAFALAFLAPQDAVKRIAPLPVNEYHVGRVMQYFGMCEAAARQRILSCYSGDVDVPTLGSNIVATPGQQEVESLKINAVPCSSRHSRQGWFADSVKECYGQGLISQDSAAFYLDCSTAGLMEAWEAQE